jgi:hypothetical protein
VKDIILEFGVLTQIAGFPPSVGGRWTFGAREPWTRRMSHKRNDAVVVGPSAKPNHWSKYGLMMIGL